MLGRRAAVSASVLVFAAGGAGVAYGATHGSSKPGTKPHVRNVQLSTPTQVRHHGSCPHMGEMSSQPPGGV